MGKAGRRDIGRLWISREVLVIGKLCSMEWNGGEHMLGTHIPFTNPTVELASPKQNKLLLSYPTLDNLVRPIIFSPFSSLAQISASTAAGIHLDYKLVAPWRSQSISFLHILDRRVVCPRPSSNKDVIHSQASHKSSFFLCKYGNL